MWLGAQCHGFQAFLNPCSPGGQKGCFRRSRKWMKRLLQLRVFRLGFFRMGMSGPGVFPDPVALVLIYKHAGSPSEELVSLTRRYQGTTLQLATFAIPHNKKGTPPCHSENCSHR